MHAIHFPGWDLILVAILSLQGTAAAFVRQPVWIKMPIVAGIILILIVLRDLLLGFATVFPIMGTIGSYEARFSLWTYVRQASVIMVCMSVMMAAGYLVQGRLGRLAALAIGWVAFLAVFLPFVWLDWRRQKSRRRVSGTISTEPT